jgi:hypothetical protein
MSAEEGRGPCRETVDGLGVIGHALIDLEEAEEERGAVEGGEAAALGDEILDGMNAGGPDGAVGTLAQRPAEKDARTPAGQHHAYLAEVVAVEGQQAGGKVVEEGFHWGKVALVGCQCRISGPEYAPVGNKKARPAVRTGLMIDITISFSPSQCAA